MPLRTEIDNFLMFELKEASESFESEMECAYHTAILIAATGKSIDGMTLGFYLPESSDTCRITHIIRWAHGTGLLAVNCLHPCSCIFCALDVHFDAGQRDANEESESYTVFRSGVDNMRKLLVSDGLL